jgi:hypothetical protein
MGTQIFGKTLILGESVRLFMEEVNIWVSRLSKEDPSSQMWVGLGIAQSTVGPRSKTVEDGWIFSLSEGSLASSPALAHWNSGSWALELQDLIPVLLTFKAFDLRLGVPPLAPLVLSLSDQTELHH